MSVPKALEIARRLPPDARLELAEKLLRGIRTARLKPTAKSQRGLETLAALGNAELQSLADAALAPSRQRKLRALLRKNRETTLTRAEHAALDELLAETDRIALLKAKALYTLTARGKNGG
ncbi:MAG: hypothetical protein HY327_09110 [Chloroflexi bacterium]|nr:hypothetical protein [Chloroflexota bacterium]